LAVAGLAGGPGWAPPAVAVSGPDIEAGAPPDAAGLAASIGATKRPLRLSRVEMAADPRRRGGDEGGSPAASLLAAPFIGRDGAVIGAIRLSDKAEGGDFSTDDEAIVRQLAHLGAVALENARLYEAQDRARAAAEEAVRERDLFLSAVSHDLRTPLTTIKGQAQLSRRRLARAEGPDAAAVAAGLARIEADAGRMNALIEDLLEVSRERAGRAIELQREPVDLVALAHAAATARRPEYAPGEIRVVAPPSLVVAADRRRVERVVTNLLENAIKYSPDRGPIELALASANGWATLTVRDQGIGIPAGERARIFDPFQRGSNAAARFHGAGIGLAGVRQIVEQHGGAIDVDSEEGVGSAFTVRLPVTESARRQDGESARE
jgi:signal transduction histidine kinase